MKKAFDLAIVGSGFGGAILALIARRLGLSVVLLERGAHPRFAIGESTSPLMNLLIEQLAARYDLPRLTPLTSYAPWKRAYPEVVCGLKRGFTYFHHQAGKPFVADPERRNQLLVAASPNEEVADTHWLRSSVDHFLVNEAVTAGVEYLDEARLSGAAWAGDVATLTGERKRQPLSVTARFVVDATGPRGFLHRALNLPESAFGGYPPTQTLYSHFTNVPRCETMSAYQTPGLPPYPMDSAALHHVFDGGWMWVLRFDNGVTSAGMAVTTALAEELQLAEGEPAWPRFLARFPTVAEQFVDAEAIHPFVYAPCLAFRSSVAAGEGWAMLPSAAGFVDPLFSTGMPLALLGIERLARLLETEWGQPAFQEGLREYGDITLGEADWTAQFIAACYAAMPDFERFAAFSMFYFTAASYSEMARRLDRPLIRRFLAADHSTFAPGLVRCAEALRQLPPEGNASFAREVAASVECLNVAGLCDPTKRNWYGVDLEDVVRESPKLGSSPTEMRRIIETASWAQAACAPA